MIKYGTYEEASNIEIMYLGRKEIIVREMKGIWADSAGAGREKNYKTQLPLSNHQFNNRFERDVNVLLMVTLLDGINLQNLRLMKETILLT